MPSTLPVAAASGLIAIAVTAWLWYSSEPGFDSASQSRLLASQDAGQGVRDGSREGNRGDVTGDSPFALLSDTQASGSQAGSGAGSDNSDATAEVTPQGLPASAGQSNATMAAELAPLDVTQVARTPLGDDEFEALVQRLRADPALLSQLVDEFRQEQDPERRARLMRLLGEAGGTDVLQAASELIYSGNAESRTLGLQLLQLVQPGNAQARDIASSLLATEVESEVLVDTLASLARPGVVDDGSRGLLVDQVALLASHEDAGVRGISLDILSRWSTDGRDTPVLINALSDLEPRVRESAAYALLGHENPSTAVVQSLMRVAQDDNDLNSTRSAAIMSLRSLPLSDAQRSELQAIEQQLNRVPR